MRHHWSARGHGGGTGDTMGVEGYLVERCLSIEALSEALCLEEHEILFCTGPSEDTATDGESDLGMILVTDVAGFRRRAESFAPDSRARRERKRVGVIYAQVAGVDVDIEVHLRSTYEDLLLALEALDPWSAESAFG